MSVPSGDSQAIEPPPAPTVTTSIIGILRRERADRALGGQRRLAVDDDRDVGRGAAAVAGQHPVEAGDLRDQRRAERAGRRPGLSTVVIGWCTTSSALSTPPLDFIT